MSGTLAVEDAVVRLDGLTVRYGRRRVLDGVSLSVARGEVYALLGRNGAGKSSAVRCLLGMQRPGGGRAAILGLDSWRGRARAMARTGVVPEEPDAPPEMTTRALGRFCAPLYPRWDAPAFAARLARLGVPAEVPFGRLSKGQKAQAMLALALGHAPELLVLDDPTLGLDAVARRGFFEELVGELADRGATVFLTSHDLAGVERIATRVGVLSGARLVVDEPLEALKARFRALRLAPGADAAPLLAPLRPVAVRAGALGVEAVVDNWSEEAAGRAGGGVAVVADAQPMSLEEIFAALAGEPEGGRA